MPDSRHIEVASYALGVLEEEEHAEFERHLLECTFCQIELKSLQEVAAALDLAKGEEKAPERPGTAGPRRDGSRPGRRTAAVFIAAGLFLAVGAGAALQQNQTSPEGIDPAQTADTAPTPDFFAAEDQGTPEAEEEESPPEAAPDDASRSSDLVHGTAEEEEDEEDEGTGRDPSPEEDSAEQDGAGIEVGYTMRPSSEHRFNGEIVLTNTGTEPVENWEVHLGFTDARVTAVWNTAGERTRDGVLLYPSSSAEEIAPGESRSLYFRVRGSPQTPSCTVDGAPCGI